MALTVFALDALDAALVDRFGLDGLTLETSGELGTYAHTKDVPLTPEVWATVATGLSPDEHGVSGAEVTTWGNPVLELASKFTAALPNSTRKLLGDVARDATGDRDEIGVTDAESVFDLPGAVVRNWPGVTADEDLRNVWDLMSEANDGLGKAPFERRLYGVAAEQFGWAREMLNHDVSLAGVHVHTPDAAGHMYAEDEASLEASYRRVEGFVEEHLAAMGEDDELLLLSDHGMQTAFLGDDEPGAHSFRAFVASTTDTVPSDVYDVAEWIRAHTHESNEGDEALNVPEQQLKDLGYI
ncbi:alkaline phosphatase family protein [Halogeometricum limi]|uniref:Type I phosphodiesterase / nucleotide pyrophosphatase n=1 Tax=Halogeometricum limi TaxID=555875 RepID=A0A1I6H6B5_9EURY|nr:alkaline phosphatase family protein [Halogeometricum limi]SFR49978.1 Type I phosphodiesterase / nucleotide pyrophosphatase [Halogeometricum limi]